MNGGAMRKAAPALKQTYPSRQARRRARRRARRLAILAILAVLACCLAIVGVNAMRRHPQTSGASSAAANRVAPAAQQRANFLQSGAVWTGSQTARLRQDVAPIVNGAVFPATTSALIADARDSRVLYEHNGAMPLVPGSTIKLITAAAALDMLGPQHRFSTTVVTDGAINSDKLDGNLWLVGGGDPELTSDDLRRGVHVISLHGIDGIRGNVYADGSRYGSDAVNATWLPEDLAYGWAAPASAISIDGGSVQFTITPKAGAEAAVAVDPPGIAQRVIASVSTASSDAENTLRIDTLPDGSGYQISGQIPYGAPQKYWRSVPHPTRAAAASLLQMLRLAGITVDGFAAEAPAPAQHAPLWEHRSRPLQLIVQRMFFDSDNHIAEELLRAVGSQTFGIGTLPKSLAAERSFLARRAIAHEGSVLADGSGLSTSNKITAAMLAGALGVLARQPLPEPYKMLPRAGIEGTVRVRDLRPEAKGRVYAKDGYIGGASGIAGYVLTAHHGPLIFVFLVNDWEHGLDAIWDGENEILNRLARY